MKKKEIKLSLFSDDMFLYIEYPKDYPTRAVRSSEQTE